LRAALAEVGVAKASIVAPAIERLGQWRTWLTWAIRLPAVALQEKVSQALQALPRGVEPSASASRWIGVSRLSSGATNSAPSNRTSARIRTTAGGYKANERSSGEPKNLHRQAATLAARDTVEDRQRFAKYVQDGLYTGAGDTGVRDDARDAEGLIGDRRENHAEIIGVPSGRRYAGSTAWGVGMPQPAIVGG
jgi:hypothetical protein